MCLTFISGVSRLSDAIEAAPSDSSRCIGEQIHHRLRLCCDPFFTCIFLRSFRHHFKTSDRTEIANVEQTQNMIPFITCEISSVSVSASWFLVSMYLNQILDSKLILSNNQSRATLWVLETCLIVRLLPFMIIFLDHCFVVFKHIQRSFLMR